jgi:acyl-CoA synthetase (AMP-forming)/AMP-acid ligase II
MQFSGWYGHRMHYGTFVARHAARYPDRVALIGNGREVSYAELDERSRRIAHGLRGLGRVTGDRIALMTDNRWECVEVMVAAARAGLVFVPLDFRLDDAAAAHLLRHSGARAAVVGGSHRDQAARLAAAGTPVDHWIHLDGGSGGVDYADLLASDDASVPPLSVPDDEGFCILYTSGTTGVPKGVYFTHQQTMDNAMAVLVEYGIGADSRYLVSYPHNSAGSVNHVIGPVLMAGGTLIVEDVRNFDADRYFATVERHRVTHSQLVPTMVFRLLATATDRDLSSLTTVGYASAPIPAPRVKEMIERFGPIFVQGYGMTETSKEIEDVLYGIPGVLEAAVIGAPDEEWGERPHAVLVPAPGHDLDSEAVNVHCRDRLPTIKRPARVTILAAMPKTSTGKISKPQLRQLLG